MRSRVYETVDRPSVCLSLCLFHHSTAAAVCGGFAAERRAVRRYRSPTAAVAPISSGVAARGRSTALSSKCEHVMLTADV